MNKAILVMMAALLVITLGIGYYSFTLNQEIDNLNHRLADSEASQTTGLDGIRKDIVTLKEEIVGEIDALRTDIDKTSWQINNQSSEIESAQDEITAAQQAISDFENSIKSMGTQLASLYQGLSDLRDQQETISQSLLNASEVYDKVKQATVRITNGETTKGSGFVYDSDGHIITAHHVIDGLTPLFIIMNDGTISQAAVTGYDELSDIAVLKLIRQLSLKPANLGDSSRLKTGDPVATLGCPNFVSSLGLPGTITAGIISQVNRATDYGPGYSVTSIIQFDAPVNPGNSGGPLLNAEGKVIGLVVARIPATQGDGIYYAVSSNKVKRVADAIIENGYFSYPWIGISPIDLTPQLTEDMSLNSINGVLVDYVSADSPAEAAGIKYNDVIIGIDHRPVKDTGELTSFLVEYHSPGDTVEIALIRDGTEQKIDVVLGAR